VAAAAPGPQPRPRPLRRLRRPRPARAAVHVGDRRHPRASLGRARRRPLPRRRQPRPAHGARTSSYALLDLSLGYRLGPLQLDLQIDNLTNAGGKRDWELAALPGRAVVLDDDFSHLRAVDPVSGAELWRVAVQE